MKDTVSNLYNMDAININQMACDKLGELLECGTVNLVSNLTGITRATLYRWLDPSIALDDMNHYHAAWLLLVCETNPKIKLLLSRGPMSHPRLAKRVIEEGEGIE